MAPILAVRASSRVPNHPIFVIPPIATLLILRHVDAKEVSEAVIALALVEIGIELGALGRRCRGHCGDCESLAFFGSEVQDFALVAERRRFATRHQAERYQSLQIWHIAVTRPGKETVPVRVATFAAIWAQAQCVPEHVYL